MTKLDGWKCGCIMSLFCAATAIASEAQVVFTVLTDIAGNPTASLAQGLDGNYYGTSYYGGTGDGFVFVMTPGGTLTTLHTFSGYPTDGNHPNAGLVLGTDGNFYGTTQVGGANNFSTVCLSGCGTVFKITPSGTLTTLYSFCAQANCTDGAEPYATLVQGTDGNFYGTTMYEGVYGQGGTVFRITPEGTLTTLHRFCAQNGCPDGNDPAGAMVQATNGDFYGTTYDGGAHGVGTLFRITAAGKLSTLYSFGSETNGADGEAPLGGLIQAANGNFYGTTFYGAAVNVCASGCGTIFEITPAGKLTTLHTFCSETNCADGSHSYAGLVQATDGNFYGTTYSGGTTGNGTAFKITPKGTLTTLHTFCSETDCADGNGPIGGLMQATNGTFYGTTEYTPVAFSLSVGLGPFVSTLPTSGIEGTAINILGQGFASSSMVKFGGVKATTVSLNGSTDLVAEVPAGALTGDVTVTTGTTTLKSNQTFRVTPQIKSFSPGSGPVGTAVTITGTELTQTTKVTFGGVKATEFTINSDSEVTATVPTGGKTGKIGITTKGGTATSTTGFTVN